MVYGTGQVEMVLIFSGEGATEYSKLGSAALPNKNNNLSHKE